MEMWDWDKIVILLSVVFSLIATIWSFEHNVIIAYGDAESHLNIAKRVVNGFTPGFAQLGGVWLFLPHLFMLPFIWSDFMWRTGLAGSIVSGVAYMISGLVIFKLVYLLTNSKFASIGAFLFFSLNPNILYLQSTPMTELPFIAFFLLSIYFFIKYLQDNNNYVAIIFSSFFTFLATLSRYDAWFLVFIESSIFLFQFILKRSTWKKTEARIVLFGVLAIFGIVLWLGWDGTILHDPFYFMNSSFSAKSQQQVWITKGELPTYKNLFLSTIVYIQTVLVNNGVISFVLAILGFMILLYERNKNKLFYVLLFFVPLFFNIYALWSGQSVLLVPSITPVNYEWHLFNARYGTVMVAVFAILISYLFQKLNMFGKVYIIILLVFQLGLFYTKFVPVVTYDDAIMGLSAGFNPDSVYYRWMKDHYEGGLILYDDYLRPISLTKSGIEMKNFVYVGDKPIYQNAIKNPQNYVDYVYIGKGDDIWKNLYMNQDSKNKLNKYFHSVLVTPEYVLYKKNKVTIP